VKNINNTTKGKIELALSLIPKDVVNKYYFLSGGYKEYSQSKN